MKTIENGCTFNTVSILFSLNKEIKEKNKNECERRDKKKSCELTCIWVSGFFRIYWQFFISHDVKYGRTLSS